MPGGGHCCATPLLMETAAVRAAGMLNHPSWCLMCWRGWPHQLGPGQVQLGVGGEQGIAEVPVYSCKSCQVTTLSRYSQNLPGMDSGHVHLPCQTGSCQHPALPHQAPHQVLPAVHHGPLGRPTGACQCLWLLLVGVSIYCTVRQGRSRGDFLHRHPAADGGGGKARAQHSLGSCRRRCCAPPQLRCYSHLRLSGSSSCRVRRRSSSVTWSPVPPSSSCLLLRPAAS
mmetsp:Transcript_36491/g.81225  ORF Transcript_36491/g.81225 Transcript_36491/m.81225 type:complete len:227 (+) Transcript_36491:927-1607(+)